jgi:hypothetical protein
VHLSECAWQAARGIRTDRYKFIRTYDSGPFNRPLRELYDLQNDPEETDNLADTLPELANELELRIEHWVTEKLAGRTDPMEKQLCEAGLPFKKRIDAILAQSGLTWEEWIQDSRCERFAEAGHSIRHS